MGEKYSLVQRAKDLFDSYETKFNPYGGKGPGFHYENMFKYGELMKKMGRDFDIDAYKTAVWLHDIGHYVKDLDENLGNTDYKREAHKDKGLEIFDREFRPHVGDSALEEKIYACIKYHSGRLDEQGKEYEKRHPELRVIREADRISFLHPSFSEHNLRYISEDKKLGDFEMLIERNYKELIETVKPSKEALEIARAWKKQTEDLFTTYKSAA